MILIDLFESRMSELDIEYQDWKNLEPVAFYSRYKMSKDQWASKHWSLIKGSQTVHEESQDDRNARIIAGEIEDAMSQGNEQLVKQKIRELIGVGYTLNKDGELQRMGMYEGAMKDLHTELAEKYRELAPKIEKYKDSFLAGQLYDALEAIAIEHDAELELKRMMTGARNRAHMDYDTNPGGFQNWFWYLPFADDTGMYESGVAEGTSSVSDKDITDLIHDVAVHLIFNKQKMSIDESNPKLVAIEVQKAYKMEGIPFTQSDLTRVQNIFPKVMRRLRKGFAPEVKDSEDIDEAQDACYHKVKSRYKVWPSAYASGALVQCRKKGAANWGNKSEE